MLHSPGSRCLDVGARKGEYSSILAKLGYRVHAIDPRLMLTVPPGVEFEQTTLEDFHREETYDLIFARNVLPFTRDPLAMLEKLLGLLSDHGVIIATFFGRREPYVRNGHAQASDPVMVVEKLRHLKIVYREEINDQAREISGRLKIWHVYTFIAHKA